MKILSANLWCYNPWQEQTIKKLWQLNNDILVFQEIKPQLVDFLRQYAAAANMTLIEVKSNQQMVLAIVSRLPIRESAIINWDNFAQRPQIRIQLSSGITIFAIHLTAPITLAKYALRQRQLGQLADLINQSSNPVISIGDFNTDVTEGAFKRFMKQTKNCAHGRSGNWDNKSWLSVFPLFAIDHLIYSNYFELQNFTINNFNGSDHLPISAVLREDF
ncbi:MAG: endonuclease/exonuclease/phosphatase family protein [Cyanobacteria bacterium J06621_8]